MTLYVPPAERRALHVSRALAEGSCYGTRSGGRFTLAVPYHRDWPRVALDLGGRYLSRSARWRFPGASAVPVARALLALFGWSVFARWPSHHAAVLVDLTPALPTGGIRVSPRPRARTRA